MKKAAFIILSIMSISLTWAQTYHPLVDTNKVWSIAHSYAQPFRYMSDFTKFEGDTTFNGHLYKQVWTTSDTTLESWNADGYIREENKQVYYLSWSGGPTNNLLYDFGANAGDTILLFSDPMGLYFVVDSVDNIILLSGESRRRVNLSGYLTGDFMGNDTWVEGMGSLYGVLQSGTCVLVGDNPLLLCFHENDTLKYFNNSNSSCFIVTGIESHQPEAELVKVFPNPSDGFLSIHVNDASILPIKIILYDPLGKHILEKELTDTDNKINLSANKSVGFVFYQLTGSNRVSKSGKILIQDK